MSDVNYDNFIKTIVIRVYNHLSYLQIFKKIYGKKKDYTELLLNKFDLEGKYTTSSSLLILFITIFMRN